MSFGEAIKKLRKDAGLSQQDVADKLGMARATYASLEVDRREPDLGELKAISEFYEISMMELVAEEGDDWPGVIHEPTITYSNSMHPYKIPQDITPQVHPEKLREVLLYVLGKVGAKPNMNETVLYRLLYFIDIDYFEKTGQFITGLTYVRNHFGPTPTKSFVEVVDSMKHNKELVLVEKPYFTHTQRKYLPLIHPSLTHLNAEELEHIHTELSRLADKTAAELSELLNQDNPWCVAKQGEPIAY